MAEVKPKDRAEDVNRLVKDRECGIYKMTANEAMYLLAIEAEKTPDNELIVTSMMEQGSLAPTVTIWTDCFGRLYYDDIVFGPVARFDDLGFDDILGTHIREECLADYPEEEES